MSEKIKQRARAAMLGLAVGDAISWPAMFHRSFLMPFWTRRIRREMDAASENLHVIRPPMPFSLNQNPQAFDLGPTDDSEWCAFTAEQLLQQNGGLDSEKLLAAWRKLAEAAEPVRGEVSTQAALFNLRNGKFPPHTGHDNPHYFDDGAMCRAVPIGVVCPGDHRRAAEFAAIDAAVTNSEDGLWAAQAMAALVTVLCGGGNLQQAIAAAQSYLPAHSWIARTVEKAMTICGNAETILEVAPELNREVINREYSYGSVAPETLAVTLAILTITKGEFEAALMAATVFAKTADSVPALVGAAAGALNGEKINFGPWRNSIRFLKGICIPNFRGRDYIELTEKLSDLASQKK